MLLATFKYVSIEVILSLSSLISSRSSINFSEFNVIFTKDSTVELVPGHHYDRSSFPAMTKSRI